MFSSLIYFELLFYQFSCLFLSNMKLYFLIKLIILIVQSLTKTFGGHYDDPFLKYLLPLIKLISKLLAFSSLLSNDIPSIKIKYRLFHFIEIIFSLFTLISVDSRFNQIWIDVNLSKFALIRITPCVLNIFRYDRSFICWRTGLILTIKFCKNLFFIVIIHNDRTLL